jgi:hypothetical protein
MKETVERYSLTGTLQSGPYLFQELGISFNDITYEDGVGYIWYACNDSSYPVRVYTPSGTLVDTISSSIIPAAHGLCFDDNGYLWVSNLNTDEIYQVDLNPIALERGTWAEIKASVGTL